MPDNRPSGGSLAYRTVHRALAGDPSEIAIEFPFYTDAHILGVGSCGPFELLNPVRTGRRTDVAAVVLRVEFHVPLYVSEMPENQGNEHYHGGGVEDEVAALTSLELGVRMKAGPASRRFERDDDPRGTPVAYEQPLRDTPQLAGSLSRPVIPSLLADATLSTRLLQRLAEMSPGDSIRLTRCARLYQDAIWIADSAPELSWLLLVSAIETAAVHWRTEREDPYESIRASGSPLVAAARDAGGEDLLQTLAHQLAELTGATRRFVQFLQEHGPTGPHEAVAEVEGGLPFGRLDWSPGNLKKVYGRIYALRSSALHSGHPFPFPMCVAPRQIGSYDTETTTLTGAMGSDWEWSEVPLLLSTFERIVREALLSYWLVPSSAH